MWRTWRLPWLLTLRYRTPPSTCHRVHAQQSHESSVSVSLEEEEEESVVFRQRCFESEHWDSVSAASHCEGLHLCRFASCCHHLYLSLCRQRAPLCPLA